MADKNSKNIKNRPPVVVVLGHVDHGKSSILEAIKDFKITSKESGGITQHIGAYQIEHEGKKITFIDTPGHEAFSAMRSRGAKIADIALLVIAAEEGLKPQTKEAIKHIKEAKLPMIVVLNKIDKPQADPERVKRELVNQDVIVESLGGTVPSINTSASTGKGIPELLEMILLVAEMEDLKEPLSESACGSVIEAYKDAKRGPVAVVIMHSGILNEGVIIGTASTTGKVKTMEDFQGNRIKQAFPSMPVIILGFEDVPDTGEEVRVFSEAEGAKKGMKPVGNANSSLIKPTGEETGKIVNLIIKTDVLGSLEAINNVLKSIPREKVGINVLKAGVGEINDSDVKLAKTSGSLILGFRVKATPIAQKLALREKVRIMAFDIIYELAQSVRETLERKLSPQTLKKDLGRIKILAFFKKEGRRQVIGGKVLNGEVKRGAMIEVSRNEEKIGKGRIIRLQREKEEVDSVGKGRECGILFEGDVQAQENDIFQAYAEEKQKDTL